MFLRIDYYAKIEYMAKVKRRFKNLILLILLLIVWVATSLLGRFVSNKTPISFIKEAQGYCCPCAAPEGCDCDCVAPEGAPEAIDIDSIEGATAGLC